MSAVATAPASEANLERLFRGDEIRVRRRVEILDANDFDGSKCSGLEAGSVRMMGHVGFLGCPCHGGRGWYYVPRPGSYGKAGQFTKPEGWTVPARQLLGNSIQWAAVTSPIPGAEIEGR